MSEFKPGDTITLVKGDDRLVREVEFANSNFLFVRVLNHAHGVEDLLDSGWTITDVKPKPEPLPSEPGVYATESNRAYTLNPLGQWLYGSEIRSKTGMRDMANVEELTRLRPEADVRREVLDRLDAFGNISTTFASIRATLRKEWGIV